MSQAPNFNHSPVVSLINGRPATTSFQIAEYFGKEHKNVLADIRALIAQCPEEFHKLNFQLMSRNVKIGNNAEREEPYYTVYFDGFILLVMGYTGPKALRMKLAYIGAFNAMKAKLEASRKPELTQSDAPITPDQQCTLRAIVKAKIGDEKNRGKLMRFYGQVWSRFANHFRIARYSQLPQSRMSEAVQYLVNLSIQPKGLDARPEQKMPEQRGLSTLDITVDQTTYEYKKRLFDQLGELLIKMETLRENIHLMGRPGARSAMLSAEKQVLYENMDDCVNGAVTGLNIAVYNLRSACRIGSRTTFCKW